MNAKSARAHIQMLDAKEEIERLKLKVSLLESENEEMRTEMTSIQMKSAEDQKRALELQSAEHKENVKKMLTNHVNMTMSIVAVNVEMHLEKCGSKHLIESFNERSAEKRRRDRIEKYFGYKKEMVAVSEVEQTRKRHLLLDELELSKVELAKRRRVELEKKKEKHLHDFEKKRKEYDSRRRQYEKVIKNVQMEELSAERSHQLPNSSLSKKFNNKTYQQEQR